MEDTKYIGLCCNEKFVNIYTISTAGGSSPDPLGEEFFFDLNVDLKTLGDAVVKALAKSRDLSISDEDLKELDRLNLGSFMAEHQWILERYPERKLFEIDACVERYNDWLKNTMKSYKYKTKKAFYENMQTVTADSNLLKGIHFESLIHKQKDTWSSGTKNEPIIEFTIPSTSSLEVIGAAVKYAIGNCRGKGADLIRSLLFPNGQPETFEKYIEELGVK